MDSQAEILNNFVVNVKESERRLTEGQDDYALEFLKIRFDSDDLRELDEFKSVVGARAENFRKNRYRDILPFDYSRVTIDTKPARSDSGDYVNASFINGANDKVAYIATQGPLKETLADFWQMVYQYEVNVVVMLCDLLESGKPKCEKYWPDAGSKLKFGELRISLVSEVRERDHYVVRTLRMKRKGGSEKERIIFQLQYFGWPDHGTPDEIAPLLEFVDRLRDYQPEDHFSPVIVHCSAGCGRTGTICALDYVRTLIRSKRVPADLSVSNLVSDLRKQRPAMVQSKEQYMLLHRAISAMFEQELARTSNPLQVNVSELFVSSPPMTPAPPVPGDNSCSPNLNLLPAPVVPLSPSQSSGLSGTSTSDDNSSVGNSAEQKSLTRANSSRTSGSADTSPAANAVVSCHFPSTRDDNLSLTSYETLSTTKSDDHAASDDGRNSGKDATTSNDAAARSANGERKADSTGQIDSKCSPNISSAALHSVDTILPSSASANYSSHDAVTGDTAGRQTGLLDFPDKLSEHPAGAKPQPATWPAHEDTLSSFHRL